MTSLTVSFMSELLPGGYTVGEQVYFIGESHTFDDGDRLLHGGQGEIVGPATAEGDEDEKDDEGVPLSCLHSSLWPARQAARWQA